MKRKAGLLTMIFVCCCATAFSAEMIVPDKTPTAHVILLHGMGRSCRSMSKMAGYLADSGYAVVNLDYPSTGADIETLSLGVVAEAVETCRSKNPEAPIHFVTHSLGGILVRHYLQNHSLPPGSRVVMLSPPNRGSEIADLLKEFFLYRWVMGPAGQQLGTSADALPIRLEPVDVPVGIITGGRSLEPWFSIRMPGPDDGKVSVASARLPEMADFLVVHRSHGFIMNGPEVIEQTIHFLRHGKFRKEG
ncbi:acetyltransferase [Desulfosarcina widdelii]|uniref:Acetyltransferase n=1 Tax=Desulfosarcina widdelii TaxID=947919 RepID=A0A5K7Z3N1_9BACT|nr:alpha/beta fold hydrolase [Desulfosarcina widdelii]BBO74859.1 acetyltransferase [Desulfosarcina widdelii]